MRLVEKVVRQKLIKEGTKTMNQYIETELTLDSFDLVQIENLIKIRVNELNDLKTAENGNSIPAFILDEQLFNYKSTLKKIKAARAEVKRIKAEADAQYTEARKSRIGRVRKSS